MHPTLTSEKMPPTEITIQGVPVQMQPDKPEKTKHKTTLIVYSSVVTALLVAVIILGGAYYHHTVNRLMDINEHYREKFDLTLDKGIKETVDIDTSNDVEIFHLKGEGIADGTMAVLDFKKSISAFYDPLTNQCFIHGGIDSRIANPSSLTADLKKNTTETTTAEVLNYKRVDSYPVRDLSVVPGPLKKICGRLQIFWMAQSQENDGAVSKRYCYTAYCYKIWRLKICVKICI